MFLVVVVVVAQKRKMVIKLPQLEKDFARYVVMQRKMDTNDFY